MFVPESQSHEEAAIDEVCRRLRNRFDSLDGREVGSAVRRAAEEFSEARVRDFVPVLVEHIARDRLAARLGSRPAVPRPRSAAGAGTHRRRP